MTDEEAFKKRVRVLHLQHREDCSVAYAYRVGAMAHREIRAAEDLGHELMRSGAVVTDVRHDERLHERVTTSTLAVVMPKNEDGSAGYAFAQQIVEQREAAVRQVAALIRAEAAKVDKTDWWSGTSAELRALAMTIDLAAGKIAQDWRNVE